MPKGLEIRVRGLVQGVGFRPNVWRLARSCYLAGHVLNDGGGVIIRVHGDGKALDRFLHLLESDVPPLARIDAIESTELTPPPDDPDFRIIQSETGAIQTGIVPDAATCPKCLEDISDPYNRRYRYPFTNCTHCGPRLSIIHTIPYDRANTAMSPFIMCDQCQGEYDDPADRRFHAQPNACPTCSPQVWLEDRTGKCPDPDGAKDAVDAASILIRQGHIVAIKGIGGFHLACDATNEKAVSALRNRKHRYDKPFALMAGNADMVANYARLDRQATRLLENTAAPVVVLEQIDGASPLVPTLAQGVAPGQNTLGFMLPYTPLHHILMQGLKTPIVMTSGNRSDEPQCITNDDARHQLAQIADYWLMHDRDILNRLDDSVCRVVDQRPQILRRARGYAPSPINLPEGFENTPKILAMGAELKNTYCLIREGQAVLSPHIGDLEDASTHAGYRDTIALYEKLFAFEPSMISIDMHSGYHSTQWGVSLAAEHDLPIDKVQHHHAHIAAAMAEHNLPIDTKPVLGIALDGLGLGDDGELWGGEFMLADYHDFTRLAHFAPIPLIGGEKAMREPWRNAYAHLEAAFGWDWVNENHSELPITRALNEKPLKSLDTMVQRGLNSPKASSAGRLFDAVAATLGLCRERVSYEGQAAITLEVLAESCDVEQAGCYDFTLGNDEAQPFILSWGNLWRGILDDLEQAVPTPTIAARFHNTLAEMIKEATLACAKDQRFKSVALSGGVFQNRLLLENTATLLRRAEFNVINPLQIPANDGGIAFGQAIITAARQQLSN